MKVIINTTDGKEVILSENEEGAAVLVCEDVRLEIPSDQLARAMRAMWPDEDL